MQRFFRLGLFFLLALLSLVRAGQAAFVDNGDTITDTVTGLEWQKATAPGTYTWQEALAYCEGLTLGGHSDWRLPDKNELRSLVDYSRYSPAIDPVFAATTASSYYWSSTTYADNTHFAWLVYFDYGDDGYGYLSSSYYVRAVRGGQSGSLGSSGYFAFDSISGNTVTAGVGFPVHVEARTAGDALDTSVNGNISLTVNYGNIYPVMLNFENGVASDTVKVYGEGANRQLRVWQAGGRTGVSDYFSTSGAGGCKGNVAFLHNAEGITVTIHDAHTGAEVARDVSEMDHNHDDYLTYFYQQPCGQYIARAEKDGKRKELSFAVTKKPVTLRLDLTSGSKTPVVLVPGMMGSTHLGSSGMAPSMEGDFPDRELAVHFSNLLGWEEMKKALEDDGYPVVLCPWDWRNGNKDSMQGSVDTFLIPAINEALQYSSDGNGPVHIVAHSMGGLLARSYIQSDLYRGDVMNLALVAVPNLGSANPYFLAEGGDMRTNEAVFGKTFVVFDNIYEKTIEKLWKKTHKNSFQGKKYKRCNAQGIQDFIEEKGPGMLQLLSTQAFLTKTTGPAGIASSDFINNWLNWLNNGEHGFHAPSGRFSASGGSKVKTRVFLGIGNTDKTLRWINVGSSAGELYPDGKPTGAGSLSCGSDTEATGWGVLKGDGDGTVPLESARYPVTQGWADQDSKVSDEEHAYIMKDFRSEIIGFLNGTRSGTTAAASKSAIAKAQSKADATEPGIPELTFSVEGSAGLLVTDSQGRRSGIVFDTQEVVNEIPGAAVTSSDVASSVVIENAAAGQYSLTYYGYEENAFSLNVMAVNAAGAVEEEEFEGYKPAAPQTMTILYDPAGAEQIMYHVVVEAPLDMEEKSYTCGSAPCVSLKWQAPTDFGVTGYVVYRKLPDGEIYSEIARLPATTKSYNTGEAWDSVEGMPVNVYAVSAIKAGEVESFFANEKVTVYKFPWTMFLPAITGKR